LSQSTPSTLIGAIALYRDIALLRRGPEDLPISQRLLTATCMAYAAVNLLLGLLLPDSAHAVLVVTIDIALMLLSGWLILQLAKHTERYLQTMTAVFGYQLLLTPPVVMASWLLNRYFKDEAWRLPAMFLFSVLGLWVLVIYTRILRSATQWPVFSCVSLVIAQSLLTQIVLSSLFPETKSP
jgi:cytochrome bd-type quinol oxidase subunit 2